MKKTIVVISMGCLIVELCSGCLPGFSRLLYPEHASRFSSQHKSKGFDIPPSLVWRMYQAHNTARDRILRQNDTDSGQNFDGEEMFGLLANGFTNAEEIAARPRGEMTLCNDMLTEDMRKDLWPFNVEAFEAELESKMVR